VQSTRGRRRGTNVSEGERPTQVNPDDAASKAAVLQHYVAKPARPP
jgi:hypothetical protein